MANITLNFVKKQLHYFVGHRAWSDSVRTYCFVPRAWLHLLAKDANNFIFIQADWQVRFGENREYCFLPRGST